MAPAIEPAVAEALDYLLAAVGDSKVEGEALTLRHKIHDLWAREYSEFHPAKVSDVYGDPRQKLAAAQAAFAAAQANLAAAEVAADQGPDSATAKDQQIAALQAQLAAAEAGTVPSTSDASGVTAPAAEVAAGEPPAPAL
jgi:hypothetical protein